MISKTKYIIPLRKPICLVAASMLLACAANAQVSLKREKYDSIATKYKSENAVYTNYTYKLKITEENGELAANSYVTMEKLLISDLSLNLYNHDHFIYSDFNMPTDLSGVAYIPERKDYKKVDVTGFGQGGVKTNLFYDGVKYLLAYYSGLKKNSIIETRYSLEHESMNMLPTFEYVDDIPVLYASFEVSAPKYVKMNFVYKGFGTEKIHRTEEESNNIVTYKFTVTNVPAGKIYDNVPSPMYYTPHIIPYIVSYRFTGAAKDSVMAADADALHNFENKFVRGMNIQTDTPLNNTVAAITKNDRTEWEKANHICQWVSRNMHYIGFEKGLQGFVPRNADTVFKRKYGDCKDMASVAMAMCHRAGLKAYFTLIGTTDIPYNHKDVPLTNLWNHMICAVMVDGKWMFIDGTHPEIPFGHLRNDVQGKEAMILINDKDYEIVNMPVEPSSLTTEVDTTEMSISFANINGTIKQYQTGFNAWNMELFGLRRYKNEDLDRLMRMLLMRGNNKFVLKNYQINQTEEGQKELTTTGNFTLNDYVEQVGNQYFINMNMQRYFAGYRVNDSDRKVGLYFDNEYKGKDVTILNIPDDCKVSYVPKDAKGVLDGYLSYNIAYKVDAKKKTITRTCDYELKTLSIDQSRFKENNRFVDDLKNVYKESVVLTAKKISKR